MIQDSEENADFLLKEVERFHWSGPGLRRGAEPIGLSKLTLDEVHNLDRAVKLVRRVRQFPNPVVCTFRGGEQFHGLFRASMCGSIEDAEIFLSRHILKDFKHTLEVLVHEVAHYKGVDGSQRHLLELQSMWSELVVHVLG